MNKWDRRWLRMAREVSTWSKDPSTKVGAIIAFGKEFTALGYNGFPESIKDDERLLNREEKLDRIIHAEMNAILKTDKNLNFCTLYTYPMMPCHKCTGIIIETGITKVVTIKYKGGKWEESFRKTRSYLREANIELVEVDHELIQ